MRNSLKSAILLGMACRSTSLFAQLKSFGEAEGFGAFATGGRGGTVYHVTNLNDSGAGSFRDAVSVSNRIVVFDLGGYINLSSAVSVKSNITILGQTAPGDGIGIMGREVSFNGSSNDIVRNIRFRQGDLDPDSSKSGINLLNSSNMMFDHVSIEFAQWNNIDAVGADQITVQNSIIANPIGQQFNAHTETVGGSFTWANNVFANAHNRSPLAKINNQFVNNVVYNYQAGYTAGNTGTPFSHDIVNNYFITGPSTTSSGNDFYQIGGNQKVYAVNNILDSNNDGKLNGSLDASIDSATNVLTPWSASTLLLPTLSPTNAFSYDLAHAGATAHGNDQVDAQVIADVASLGVTGHLWTHQTSTGLANSGYGVLNDGQHIVDTNNNGIADAWETAHGLLLSDAKGYQKLNPVGYTMLEQYANELTNSAANKTWTASGAAWSAGTNWSGGTPIVYDNALVRGTGIANGSLSVTQPGANAMTLSIGGNGPAIGETVTVSGGSLTVFDTITVGDQNNASLIINSGTVTASNIVLGNQIGGSSYNGLLSLNGGTLRASQIVLGGGTPGSYTTGGSINWSGGTFQGASDFAIGAPISIGSNHAYVDTNGFNGTISAIVSGTGNLIKQGNGTLFLSNLSNTLSGTVYLMGGLIGVSKLTNGGAPSTLGVSSANAANLVFSGGGLRYTGSGDSTDRLFTLTQSGGTIDGSGSGGIGFVNTGPIAFTGTGNRTLSFVGAETHTSFSPALGDPVGYQTALTKDGTGRLLWTSKLSTYSGDTTILTGTIQPYNGGVLPFGFGKGNLIVDVGGTYSGSGSINGLKDGPNGGGLVNGTGGLVVGNGDANGTFTGIVSGAMSVTKVGAGLQTFSGTNANTYTGPTIINGGAILFGDANSIGGTSKVTVNSGGAVGFTPGVADPGLLARLDTDSTGALGLSGSNDAAATLNFTTGALLPYANMAVGSAGNVTYTGQYTPLAGIYRLGGGYGTLTFAPIIAGTNHVLIGNVGSTGTVILTGANTYTGTTTLRGSILSVGALENGGINSSIGASSSNAANLVFDGGVLKYTGSGSSTDRSLTLTPNGGTIDSSGSGEIDFTNTAYVIFSGTGNRVLTLTGLNGGNHSTFDATLADPVSGKLSVVKSGSGRWFIGVSNNTYSGDTTISGGTLQAWVDNILPSGLGRGNLNLSAGTLQMYGHNQNLNGLNGAGNIDNSSGTRSLTLGNGDASGNFSGSITGGVNVTKSGAGAQILSGNNSFTGTAQVSNGSLEIAGGTFAPSMLTNASSFIHSGGSITVPVVANSGAYTQTGGTATIGSLTSTAGTITVGGGISSAVMSVASIDASAVTIGNGGTVIVPSAAVPSTLKVTSLTVSPGGMIDLQNNSLLVNNTSTPLSRVKTYVDAAYNLAGSTNVAGVVGDYSARSGITSSVARASYGADFRVSLGYYDGAQQANIGSVVGPNSQSGNGTGIGVNQILIRPTLTGDLNGDGTVDDYDIAIFNAFNLYKSGQTTTLGWQAGDFNGDGKVDDTDIAIFNAGNNYNNGKTYVPGAGPVASDSKAAVAYRATQGTQPVQPVQTTLAGRSASAAVARGTFVFTYDPSTGDVKLSLNGYAGLPGEPVDPNNLINSLDIKTTGALINGISSALNPAKLTAVALSGLALGAPRTATEIKLISNVTTLADGTDLGMILQPGLDPNQLAAALTLQFNYKGSYTVSNITAGLQTAVPEPATLSLLGLGAVGLLARRRRVERIV